MKTSEEKHRVPILDRLIEETLNPRIQLSSPPMVRALITEIQDNGEILVQVPPDEADRFRCDFLQTGSNATLVLQPGDLVLVMRPAGPGQNGCVLGRVGRYHSVQKTGEAPPHVVLEAGESMTFKCGESSIALRKDGKLMIQGNDVLSRAKRCQRIKGGTVAIN